MFIIEEFVLSLIEKQNKKQQHKIGFPTLKSPTRTKRP